MCCILSGTARRASTISSPHVSLARLHFNTRTARQPAFANTGRLPPSRQHGPSSGDEVGCPTAIPGVGRPRKNGRRLPPATDPIVSTLLASRMYQPQAEFLAGFSSDTRPFYHVILTSESLPSPPKTTLNLFKTLYTEKLRIHQTKSKADVDTIGFLSQPYLDFLSSADSKTEFTRRFGLLLSMVTSVHLPHLYTLHSTSVHATSASYALLLHHLLKTSTTSQVEKYSAPEVWNEMQRRSLHHGDEAWGEVLGHAARHSDWDTVARIRSQMARVKSDISRTAWIDMVWSKPVRQTYTPLNRRRRLVGPPSITNLTRQWKWDWPDGDAALAMTKRLLAEGRWQDAVSYVNRTLMQSLSSLMHNQTDELKSGWPLKLLKALVDGAWRMKWGSIYSGLGRQFKSIDQIDSSTLSTFRSVKARYPGFVPFPSAFTFATNFINQHSSTWSIKPDAALVSSCLRYDQGSTTTPSFLISQLGDWVDKFGMNATHLGSLCAVRILHSMSSSIHQTPSCSLSEEGEKLTRWWYDDCPLGGHLMMSRGPIDGQFHRGQLCWFSFQDVYSIKASISVAEQSFQLSQGKLEMMSKWQEGCIEEQTSHGSRLYQWLPERPGKSSVSLGN